MCLTCKAHTGTHLLFLFRQISACYSCRSIKHIKTWNYQEWCAMTFDNNLWNKLRKLQKTKTKKESHKNEWEIIEKLCKKWSNPPLFELVLLPDSFSYWLHLKFKTRQKTLNYENCITCFCYFLLLFRYYSFSFTPFFGYSSNVTCNGL